MICRPLTTEEIEQMMETWKVASLNAMRMGFDGIQIHAHAGYLMDQFMSEIWNHRTDKYGGSFENRTRFFREIAEGIKEKCPKLAISARVGLFDIIPFIKGKDGVGKPMDWEGPYPYAFGGAGDGLNMDPDLKETAQFVKMLQSCGVELICATIGSPYYNVHMQRPAWYPVCDGYLPPENPLFLSYDPKQILYCLSFSSARSFGHSSRER